MSGDPSIDAILFGLLDAGVELIVVGGTAAVMQGAPIVTQDLDIVHRRTEENVDRLLPWLLAHGAYHRFDLANRRLPHVICTSAQPVLIIITVYEPKPPKWITLNKRSPRQ